MMTYLKIKETAAVVASFVVLGCASCGFALAGLIDDMRRW